MSRDEAAVMELLGVEPGDTWTCERVARSLGWIPLWSGLERARRVLDRLGAVERVPRDCRPAEAAGTTRVYYRLRT